jgi:protein-L-isoaspartate(D-aspartate) O-methyltransferase
VPNAELNGEGARENNSMDAGNNHDWAALRQAMIEEQIRKRGISSPRLLEALARVPRHLFVPEELALHAYEDRAIGIGEQQTISQPYMVASMTDYLELQGSERVLEVGAGSGYQAAVLAELAGQVITVEKNVSLADSARARLASLGYGNVRVEIGDGTLGWPDAAPFDAILVAAASPAVPPPLVAQLAEGGRLVIPVGESNKQTLMRIRKRAGEITQEKLFACQFVPLLGRYGWPDAVA